MTFIESRIIFAFLFANTVVLYQFSLIDLLVVSFVLPFSITFLLMPVVFRVAVSKDIVAHENGRTSHRGNIPLMGGIAIFMAFYVSSLILINSGFLPQFRYLLAGSIIMLMVGLKDDVTGIPALKKFGGQILAASIMVFLGNIRFTHLHGFLGFDEISYGWSVIITMVTIVGLSNCFNLIDGVDGLAAGLSCTSLMALALWFGLVGHYELMSLALILSSAILAYLPFNLRNKGKKIFMGDTGSLGIGFVIAFLIIEFNQVNIGIIYPYDLISAPAVSIGIVFVPVFDTLRVMLIRILNKKSPFSADKIHTHHNLLELGFNHHQTSLSLVLLNIGFIVFSFFSHALGSTLLLAVLLSLGMLIFFLPWVSVRMKKRQAISDRR